MTTIRKAIAAVLKLVGLQSAADWVYPEGAGGAGPLPPPRPK